MAAKAFFADFTFFSTAGSTESTHIALDAISDPTSTFIVDKGCHQAVHFALRKQQARVDYIETKQICRDSERQHIDFDRLLSRLEETPNAPSTVVLNSASYDGVIYKLDRLMRSCLSINKNLNFFIDEAWSAAGVFSPSLRPHMAMPAAEGMRKEGNVTQVASIQSAHKSLNAMRQGSYIHLHGNEHDARKFQVSTFSHHTTSPSYPILASLDLARAQMEQEGEQLTQTAIEIADHIRSRVSCDNNLSQYRINYSDHVSEFVFIDPTKLSINTSQTGVSPSSIRKILFEEHGIYISRYTDTSILLNIHIGISWADADLLLDALAHIQKQHQLKPSISNHFYIPYPPGVPFIFPGDVLNDEKRNALARIQQSGVTVIEVPASIRPSTEATYNTTDSQVAEILVPKHLVTSLHRTANGKSPPRNEGPLLGHSTLSQSNPSKEVA